MWRRVLCFTFCKTKRTKQKQSCLYFCSTVHVEKGQFVENISLVTFAIPPMRTGGRAMIIQPEKIKEQKYVPDL